MTGHNGMCNFIYCLLLYYIRIGCSYVAFPLASFCFTHMHLCRLLSVVLYLMFLFMIIIVLLNTLIAQVSDTYTKVLSTAERVHLYYQCAYIAKVEKQKIQYIILCLKILCCCASVSWLCVCPLCNVWGTKDALYCVGAKAPIYHSSLSSLGMAHPKVVMLT